MDNGSSKQAPKDINEIAFRVAGEAISDIEPDQKTEKNSYAMVLGRAGGKIGGKARALKLTAEERSEMVRKVAMTQWHGHRQSPKGEIGAREVRHD